MDFMSLTIQVMPKPARNGIRMLFVVMLADKSLQVAAYDYTRALGVEDRGTVALEDADVVTEAF
jgi:hypothetical protein